KLRPSLCGVSFVLAHSPNAPLPYLTRSFAHRRYSPECSSAASSRSSRFLSSSSLAATPPRRGPLSLAVTPRRRSPRRPIRGTAAPTPTPRTTGRSRSSATRRRTLGPSLAALTARARAPERTRAPTKPRRASAPATTRVAPRTPPSLARTSAATPLPSEDVIAFF
ncbi:hypothetical protein C8R44DRAFT_982080, partial [Mycena epipterygia]